MPTTTQENLITVINPATEEELIKIPISSYEEIKDKVLLAKDSFPFWSNLSLEKRIQYISRIYEIIINDREKIAQVITKNNGKPLSESYLTEIASTLQVMEYFIKNTKGFLIEKDIKLGTLYPTKKSYITYEPFGVVAIISPWNYPLYLPLSAITKTLITGNTFVFKPSSSTSLIGKQIEEILTKAELPNGVSNLIYGGGEVARELIKLDIDKVIFTGSVETGKEIAENCAKRLIPVSLELGGKDPAVVFKSSNIEYACGGILWGALSNTGQACASIERVYVESDIHNEFVEKLTLLIKELKVGNGLDDETDIGPLINNEQLTKVEEHINDATSKGAKIAFGGKRINKKGFFFEPTILTNVNHKTKIMTEETFGPVIPIMRFETTEEAIRLANDSRYGLASSLWISEIENAKTIARSLNCGTVWINDSLFLQAHPACPWNGYKESGYGSTSIYDFVKTKHISVDQGFIPMVRPKSYWWYPYKGKARSYNDLIEVLFKEGIKSKAQAAFQTIVDFLKWD